MRSFLDAKLMAKALREALSERAVDLSHSAALEIVARQFGMGNWNILAAKIENEAPTSIRLSFQKDGPCLEARANRFTVAALILRWETQC